MFATAILWSLFTLYGIMLLLPFMDRRLREGEIKLKRSQMRLATPNRPQRVVFLLLTCVMTSVGWTSALGRDLRETVGISSGAACSLMIILPALYFALGLLKQPHQDGPQPDA